MSDLAGNLEAARERLQAERPAPYLTKGEAAELARCNPKTIQSAIHSGQLRAFRPARRVLLREEDVRAWIESRSAASPRPEPRPARARRASPGSVSSLRALDPELGR